MIISIESIGDVLPLWMLLFAAFGFIIGDAYGDRNRHRKCLEESNADLRAQLDLARTSQGEVAEAIRHQRGVIHDIHKYVSAISKIVRDRLS